MSEAKTLEQIAREAVCTAAPNDRFGWEAIILRACEAAVDQAAAHDAETIIDMNSGLVDLENENATLRARLAEARLEGAREMQEAAAQLSNDFGASLIRDIRLTTPAPPTPEEVEP